MLIASCQQPKDALQADDAAIADESQTENWLAYGRTHNERRFSPMKDINENNVANLKVDWYIDLPNDRGLVSTPLVIDGVLYFCGTMNIVKAVDATSGKLIWEYDPEVAKHVAGKRQIGWVHNRGISFYKGKIYAATWDGRLIALDAKTGKEIWSAQTFAPTESLYITGAPKAFKDKILIGNGGTEYGPSRGYVTAYDAETGKQAWRFYIVPGNPADGFENEAMEMAAKTWTGEWWKHGGGGNAWHGFTYDADLDVLYIGTGNGSPWNRKIRSPGGGDNLFLSSIVALDPDDGKYLWHYQTTPGESWDYNSNMDIVLADLKIDGKMVKTILHAPKNGFFYVINRETGKLISADPFVETSWASHVDLATGRPVEVPGARYENGQAEITPSPLGGHSWQSMSFNPNTGLVYFPVMHFSMTYSDDGIDVANWQNKAFQRGTGVNTSVSKKQPREYLSSLLAWDPIKKKPVWSVPQNDLWNAGTLTTAGNLVFQGRADGKFLAFDANTGDELWSFDTGLGISAPPITYSVNGRQYIALLVGWGGALAGTGGMNMGWGYGVHTRRLVVFSLEGVADMPKLPPRHSPTLIEGSNFILDNNLAQKGVNEYSACAGCHGKGGIANGMAPDLRASPIPLEKASFNAVVRDGAKVSMGMPAFPEMTDEQLTALMHYIRQQARAGIPKSNSNGSH
ncbi:PQQ-dependent dehydrogenase, methanol/ethanol family [Algoriphagus lacus]|uniref:PQQ-dependent dehydrogenase, methanol/ethanol family n=2 Tax=Algoriphagus lacus TaxID=2056311 RepID=A0A418PPU6_9BACT|nr:PQQ-dependent dehydrogenase, methanol/ethanol family [Algoriphagus lacus]